MPSSNAQILTLCLQVLAFQKEYEASSGFPNDRPGNLVEQHPPQRPSPTTANPSAWDKIREKVLIGCLQACFFAFVS
jgi:hypothetical protein